MLKAYKMGLGPVWINNLFAAYNKRLCCISYFDSKI